MCVRACRRGKGGKITLERGEREKERCEVLKHTADLKPHCSVNEKIELSVLALRGGEDKRRLITQLVSK